MAAGTAVVASDIPGYRNVARPGQEALLVAPDDPAALRAALRRLLDDDDRRRRIARAASRACGRVLVRRGSPSALPLYEAVITRRQELSGARR